MRRGEQALRPEQLYKWWSAAWSAAMRGFGLAVALYWVVDLELGAFQLVALGTAMEVGVFLAEVPTGVVADTYSRRLSITISHMVIGASVLAMGFISSYWMILVAQFVWGIGYTFKSGADVAWVTDELGGGSQADETIAAAGIWSQVGSVVGIVMFGLLGAVTSHRFAIIASGLTVIVLGIAVRAIFEEHGFDHTGGASWSDTIDIAKAGWRLARADRVIMGVFLATLLLDMGSEAIDRLGVKQLVELGFPSGSDPILWLAALSVVTFLLGAGFLVLSQKRIASDDGPKRLFLLGILAILIGSLAIATAPSLAYALVGLLLFRSVSHSVIGVTTSVWVNRSATKQVRATLQSFLGQVGSFGEVAGGLLLGAVAQTVGLSAAFVGSAVFFALAGMVVWRIVPRASPGN